MKEIIYTLIAIVVLTSCEKFLDVKPVGKLIPTKVEEFERLLNNAYIYQWDYLDNNVGCALALLGDNYEYSETAFDAELNSANPNADRLMAYKFNRPYWDPYKSDYYWDWGIYRAAYYYNNVVDGINDVGSDEAYAKQILAQALAGRALNYLNATYVYGPSYKPGEANDTKTIPYRVAGSATAANPDLSTTQEVFDLAEAELLEALEDIPATSGPTRFNKVGVETALAYLYMLKGDFAKMLTYANQAVNNVSGGIESHIYDYNLFEYVDNGTSPSPGADPETNWDLKYDNGSDGDFNKSYSKEIILYRRVPNRENYAYPSQEFTNLFSENDQRKRLFLLWATGYSNSSGAYDGIVKKYYKSTKLGSGSSTGFSYPELLLMRAEAYARNSQDVNALADLNTLRKYRYSGNSDLTALSGDALLEEILNERRRELPSPSYRRFIDIKRFDAYDAGKSWAKSTMVHQLYTYTAVPVGQTPLAPVASGRSFSATVDSEIYIWPISNTILDKNPQWGIPSYTGTYIVN